MNEEESGCDCLTIYMMTLVATDVLFQPGRPPPSLQALTVEREVSNDDDEFGGSDDEIGDEETQQIAGTFFLHQFCAC